MNKFFSLMISIVVIILFASLLEVRAAGVGSLKAAATKMVSITIPLKAPLTKDRLARLEAAGKIKKVVTIEIDDTKKALIIKFSDGTTMDVSAEKNDLTAFKSRITQFQDYIDAIKEGQPDTIDRDTVDLIDTVDRESLMSVESYISGLEDILTDIMVDGQSEIKDDLFALSAQGLKSWQDYANDTGCGGKGWYFDFDNNGEADSFWSDLGDFLSRNKDGSWEEDEDRDGKSNSEDEYPGNPYIGGMTGAIAPGSEGNIKRMPGRIQSALMVNRFANSTVFDTIVTQYETGGITKAQAGQMAGFALSAVIEVSTSLQKKAQ